MTHALRRCLAVIEVMALLAYTSLAIAASTPQPWKGGPAPDLTLKDLDGRVHRLSDYRGKAVLINFWATWCEPCREEMPSIQALRTKLAGQPLVVLAVNVDEPEARVRRFLAQTAFAMPVLLDPNKTATRAWSVRVLPATFVVGPDGRVRYQLIGEMDWNSDTAIGLITKLMGGG